MRRSSIRRISVSDVWEGFPVGRSSAECLPDLSQHKTYYSASKEATAGPFTGLQLGQPELTINNYK